jgi:dipeptidyl aminopeptidase/acylaminoacyl peptidase
MPAHKKGIMIFLLGITVLMLWLLYQYSSFYWRINNNLVVTAFGEGLNYSIFSFEWFRFVRLMPEGTTTGYHPVVWSPDGKRIAYTYWYDYKEDDTQIYIAVLDMNTKEVITTIPVDDSSAFAWSPASNDLLISFANNNGSSNLYIYDISIDALSPLEVGFDGEVKSINWGIGKFPLIHECLQEICSIYILKNNLSEKDYVTQGRKVYIAREVHWIEQDIFVVYDYSIKTNPDLLLLKES